MKTIFRSPHRHFRKKTKEKKYNPKKHGRTLVREDGEMVGVFWCFGCRQVCLCVRSFFFLVSIENTKQKSVAPPKVFFSESIEKSSTFTSVQIMRAGQGGEDEKAEEGEEKRDQDEMESRRQRGKVRSNVSLWSCCRARVEQIFESSYVR